ncbi:MAG: hypothetical protein KF784_08330 [Fimbriimonadaceae bacterium]|nr:hypothetical protein [Fimbriimonadaceae bacterium]
MKKYMLVCAVLTITLFGCSQEIRKPRIPPAEVTGHWKGELTDGRAKAEGEYTAEFRADGTFTMKQGSAQTTGKYTVEGNHVNLMIENLNGMAIPSGGAANSRGLDVSADGKSMADAGGTGSLTWVKQ